MAKVAATTLICQNVNARLDLTPDGPRIWSSTRYEETSLSSLYGSCAFIADLLIWNPESICLNTKVFSKGSITLPHHAGNIAGHPRKRRSLHEPLLDRCMLIPNGKQHLVKVVHDIIEIIKSIQDKPRHNRDCL